MNTTIQSLAAEFNIEQHEVLAGLDITDQAVTGTTEIDSIDGWTEDEAREVLTTLAQQAANLA
ncbi:hypothetical protein [Microbacterium sp. gxy059]|uniref:hypothetical protein n=1 Tax=Microbacterium sp. gxy059 TaxID=2957199 RepID=UPI003D959F2B